MFLSLREPFEAIHYFSRNVMPKITSPIVLVSGSEDITIPRQTDCRWRSFNDEERVMIERVRKDPRVLHWFIENRDQVLGKTSSMPLGYVLKENQSHSIRVPDVGSRLADRPLKALCAHRVRKGPQWETRRQITRLCRTSFSDFVDVVDEEMSVPKFIRMIRERPFVICAKGGGLDPSPKAWLTLMQGSIPIIESSSLDDAYSLLPVAIVKDWSPDCLSAAQLRHWLQLYSPYFEKPELRQEVCRRLSLDYWWGRVTSQLGRYWWKTVVTQFRMWLR